MPVPEILPALRELTRDEKLQVMEFLAREVGDQELLESLAGEQAIWSPYDAYGAANILLEALRSTNESGRGCE